MKLSKLNSFCVQALLNSLTLGKSYSQYTGSRGWTVLLVQITRSSD